MHTIVSGGSFRLKGVPQDPTPRRMTVWLHEEPSSVLPYGPPISTMFKADRIAIEKLDGTVVAELSVADQRRAFVGFGLPGHNDVFVGANEMGVPRFCRGGSQTLRIPGVYLRCCLRSCRSPLSREPHAVAFALAFHRLRSGPFEGPATVKPPALPEDTYFPSASERFRG
jgi:hypothetical protein